MYIFDNLIVNCFFQGAPKEEILRCSVADDNTFSDNVFLNKQLTNEAEKDFEAVKVYAVELEHLSMFDKAKHCASIFSYKKVWQWPMTNNITLAFISPSTWPKSWSWSSQWGWPLSDWRASRLLSGVSKLTKEQILQLKGLHPRTKALYTVATPSEIMLM